MQFRAGPCFGLLSNVQFNASFAAQVLGSAPHFHVARDSSPSHAKASAVLCVFELLALLPLALEAGSHHLHPCRGKCRAAGVQ